MEDKIIKKLDEVQKAQTQLGEQLARIQITFKKQSDELMTAKEACSFAKMSRTKFDELRADGLIKVYKVRGKLIVKKSELMEYIESTAEQKPQRA